MTDTLSLLHLDSSATRGMTSVSRRLTAAFAEVWRREHPGAGYRHRDLAADPVPLVTEAYCRLGQRVERRGGVPVGQVAGMTETVAEQQEWARTRPFVEELLAATVVLLGVPMYNFAVPAALKAWIDRVTFPGVYTGPATGDPLLAGTRVVVVTARGGGYGPGTPRAAFDHQEPYLRRYFGNLGVSEEDMFFVHAEFTRAADVPALAQFAPLAVGSLATAQERVAELAAGVSTHATTGQS